MNVLYRIIYKKPPLGRCQKGATSIRCLLQLKLAVVRNSPFSYLPEPSRSEGISTIDILQAYNAPKRHIDRVARSVAGLHRACPSATLDKKTVMKFKLSIIQHLKVVN